MVRRLEPSRGKKFFSSPKSSRPVRGTHTASYSMFCKNLWDLTNFTSSTYIQGISWLVDITAGGDFLSLCDQKSSYKHVSDFGELWSYGHFLIPVHVLVWTAPYGTSWQVMYSTWRLTVCGSSNEQLAQFTTERQAVLRPVVAFSKTSFKHRSIQIKGNFMKLTLHLYLKCIMYYAGLSFCSIYCQ